MEDVGGLAQGPERSQAAGARLPASGILGDSRGSRCRPGELARERLEGGRRRGRERGEPGCVLVAERIRAGGPCAWGEAVAQLAEHVVQVVGGHVFERADEQRRAAFGQPPEQLPPHGWDDPLPPQLVERRRCLDEARRQALLVLFDRDWYSVPVLGRDDVAAGVRHSDIETLPLKRALGRLARLRRLVARSTRRPGLALELLAEKPGG